MSEIADWQPRQKVSAEKLTQMVRAINRMAKALGLDAGALDIGDAVPEVEPGRWFLGEVVDAGPFGETDYPDDRYWVRRCRMLRGANSDAVYDWEQEDPWNPGTGDVPVVHTVTNLSETLGQTHRLPLGFPVLYRLEFDPMLVGPVQAANPRYVMQVAPPPVRWAKVTTFNVCDRSFNAHRCNAAGTVVDTSEEIVIYTKSPTDNRGAPVFVALEVGDVVAYVTDGGAAGSVAINIQVSPRWLLSFGAKCQTTARTGVAGLDFSDDFELTTGIYPVGAYPCASGLLLGQVEWSGLWVTPYGGSTGRVKVLKLGDTPEIAEADGWPVSLITVFDGVATTGPCGAESLARGTVTAMSQAIKASGTKTDCGTLAEVKIKKIKVGPHMTAEFNPTTGELTIDVRIDVREDFPIDVTCDTDGLHVTRDRVRLVGNCTSDP